MGSVLIFFYFFFYKRRKKTNENRDNSESIKSFALIPIPVFRPRDDENAIIITNRAVSHIRRYNNNDNKRKCKYYTTCRYSSRIIMLSLLLMLCNYNARAAALDSFAKHGTICYLLSLLWV